MDQATRFPGPGVQSALDGRGWWREIEVVWLVLLVAGIYLTRPAAFPARGEETRRGRVAWEMLATGDYLIPREQGLPELTRPPVQYWAIALAGAVRGRVDVLSVRLPSLVATLLTVLLIYGYGRTFLSRLGALGAAAGYATMVQVLQLGRLGETEAVFTLLLSAALLVWHWGDRRRWPPLVTWLLGYGLAALATLAKGPQAPVYFVGGVGAYLLVQRRWREAFSWSHLVGIVAGVAMVAAWQVPFARQLGAEHAVGTYTVDVLKRFADTHVSAILTHLALYPLDTFACLLPWSLLLLPYADPRFRAAIGAARPAVCFLVCVIVVAFPSVWLPPQSNTRYAMPLYPCFALLIGLVIDRAFYPRADADEAKHWRRFVWGFAAALPLGGLAVLAASLAAPAAVYAQPLGLAMACAAYGVIGAGVLVWSARQWPVSRARVALVVIAAGLGLGYTGVATNVIARVSADTAAAIAEVQRTLPDDARLCTFVGVNPCGVNHVFTFYYQQPIPRYPWPKTAADAPPEIEYFCFDTGQEIAPPPLPFAWEPIARISCDRTHKKHPEWEVVIGRRLDLHGAPRQPTDTAAIPRATTAQQ